MERNQQQAYDRGTSIYSPDGRLYQVEYAREAVKRGTGSVGIETADGIVLAANRRVRSRLIKSESVNKIYPVDDHLAVASAGNVADTHKLVEFCRVEAQKNRHELNEPIDVEGMTNLLTDHLQDYTQTGGARPFGVALLVGGVVDGESRLFAVDPSGTPYEWYATAIGNGSDEACAYLEETYEEDVDLGSGIDLALETLNTVADELTPSKVDLTVVEEETATVRSVSDSEIESHLAELDLDD